MSRKDSLIEIFNANKPQLQTYTSLSGAISIQNDRFCKSLILSLNKSDIVQIPKSSRQHLNIQACFITFQVFLTSKAFSLEIFYFDTSNTKRKILLNNCRNYTKDTIQSKVSTSKLPKECWLNLCVDLGSLSLCSFLHGFYELDSIRVLGPCKVCRIFATSQAVKELPFGYELPSFSKMVCVDSKYVEDTASLLDKKRKVLDENFRFAEDKKNCGEYRGFSASNRSCARILTTRYLNKGANKVLKPIKKAESFFENAVNSLENIRHSTPPFVNVKKECLTYDPISKVYVNK